VLPDRTSDGPQNARPGRSRQSPGAIPPVAAQLLRLQRSIGNRALARTLGVQRQAATDLRPASAAACGSGVDSLKGQLERRLDEWKREAEVGVENFADAELVRAIKRATSFNPVSFLGALIGNVIWAAACFTPAAEAAPVFALSLAGITIGAGTALPSPAEMAEGPLMIVKKGMLRMLDQAYRALKRQVPEKAARVLADNPRITTEDALEKVLRASFGTRFLLRDDVTQRATDLDDEAIRTVYQEQAAGLLDEYTSQVEPIGRSFSIILCRIEPGGLAVVETHLDDDADFLYWVEPEMAASAVAQSKAAGQEHVPTLAITDVRGVPLGAAAVRAARGAGGGRPSPGSQPQGTPLQVPLRLPSAE
jgi:hypothetical protein